MQRNTTEKDGRKGGRKKERGMVIEKERERESSRNVEGEN